MNPKTEFESSIRTTKRLVKAGHKVVLRFDTDEECKQAVEMLSAQSISCRTITREHRGDEDRFEMVFRSFFFENQNVIVVNRGALDRLNAARQT